ncbi:MAG: hypothetical protein RSA53_05525 [Odoribacter sp.]
MKPLFIILITALLCASAKPITDCKCAGKPLYGRVKIVEHHADFDVQVVEHHADLHVKKVTTDSRTCGEWRFVTDHPDFTIRIVKDHPDFKIRYVEHHPGKP